MKTFSRRGTLPEQKTFSTYNVSGKRSVLNMSLAAHEIDQVRKQRRGTGAVFGFILFLFW